MSPWEMCHSEGLSSEMAVKMRLSISGSIQWSTWTHLGPQWWYAQGCHWEFKIAITLFKNKFTKEDEVNNCKSGTDDFKLSWHKVHTSHGMLTWTAQNHMLVATDAILWAADLSQEWQENSLWSLLEEWLAIAPIHTKCLFLHWQSCLSTLQVHTAWA